MTPKHLEQALYLAVALVSGLAPIALSPLGHGLILAALHVAIAACVGLRRD